PGTRRATPRAGSWSRREKTPSRRARVAGPWDSTRSLPPRIPSPPAGTPDAELHRYKEAVMAKATANDELMQLERQYWEALKNKDPKTAIQLSDDPCLLTGSQGYGSYNSKQLG